MNFQLQKKNWYNWKKLNIIKNVKSLNANVTSKNPNSENEKRTGDQISVSCELCYISLYKYI